MRELVINVWDYLDNIDAICVPTNRIVKTNGEAVMGAGFAKQVKMRYKEIPAILGTIINNGGFFREIATYGNLALLNFPTKYNWRDDSCLSLIESSARSLHEYMKEKPENYIVCLPAPGTGKGNLDYVTQVKPILSSYFEDDHRIIATFNKPF